MSTLSKEVLEKNISPYFFETGTSNGEAVEVALGVGFEKIFSIEINEVLYRENCEKFKKEIEEGKVKLYLGDTLKVMPDILKEIDKTCTFWLDAHVDHGPKGEKLCPLLDELDYIKEYSHLNHKILIDDRRMFGQWWGTGISEQMVLDRIKNINPNYKISYQHGCIPDDIINAVL